MNVFNGDRLAVALRDKEVAGICETRDDDFPRNLCDRIMSPANYMRAIERNPETFRRLPPSTRIVKRKAI
ncbi:MAG: hypothetical protein EKK29_03095 [Hyphomicrobiales bacterium]|nr:MAG: hypothetical protein EKK29_03095 [Hyphomicrobiales bacterium]